MYVHTYMARGHKICPYVWYMYALCTYIHMLFLYLAQFNDTEQTVLDPCDPYQSAICPKTNDPQ